MVNYSHSGASIIGTGLISYSYDNHSSKSKYDDIKIRDAKRADPFRAKITKWEDITIGEIIDRSIKLKSKSGRNSGTVLNFKLMAAQELAFFVLNQVSNVSLETPCRLGYGFRNRAIRIGDMEYRSSGYKLHQRKVSA